MKMLINIALSDDPSKVIAVLSEKYIDEPDYVDQFLLEIVRDWLVPNQSCSTNEGVLRFLQTLFGCFPMANLSEEFKQFTATKLLQVIEYEDCSILILKYALNNLKSLVDKKLVNMLMMDESLEGSMKILGRKLTLVGDFEVQMILLQVLSKIARYGDEQFWSTLWFTQEDIRRNFLTDILGSTLYLDYRKFLNFLNRSKDSRVFSFIAQSVICDTVQLKKPSGSEFWIDVNFDSKSISFWYEKLPNGNNSRDNCMFIPAKFVKKYAVKAQTAAKFQELCIILNCSVGDLLDSSPFTSTSDSIKIRFWRFLDINDHLENVFGASCCESDIRSKTHKKRKISNSETFCFSDPQRYTHSKKSPGHRKMSRSCEFVPTSDVEPQFRFQRRKVSNSTDLFSIPDSEKISIDRFHRPKKASMSCDIFAFSGNEVLVETQRSYHKKISCSSGIIAVGSIEDEESYDPTPLHHSEKNGDKILSSPQTNCNKPHFKHLDRPAPQKHETLEYTKPKTIQLPQSPKNKEASSYLESKSSKTCKIETLKRKGNARKSMNKSKLEKSLTEKASDQDAGDLKSLTETKLEESIVETGPNSFGKKHQIQNSSKKSRADPKPNATLTSKLNLNTSLDVYSDEIMSDILEETIPPTYPRINQKGDAVREACNEPVSVHSIKRILRSRSAKKSTDKNNSSTKPRDKKITLCNENIPRILRSRSTSLNESRPNSKSRNLEPALDIIESNNAFSKGKSLSVTSIKENIIYMESRSIPINEKNVPFDDIISPKVSPIQKILPSNNIQNVLSQVGCISDKGERKQISPSHSLHSTPTNTSRIIISSRKKLRTSNLDTPNGNSKSPAELDCLVPKVNLFSEKGLAQEINLSHNEENSTPENSPTSSSNKKHTTKSQKMVKLYNVDGSPVQIQRLSKNQIQKSKSKARRISQPNRLMPIEDNSPSKVDSSSDFDFLPLNRNKPKSSGTNKDLYVSNDSGFKEQSSAPNLSNKSKTDETTSMSPRKDTPRESVSHEDITTETFNACSPNNEQEGNERTNIEDENTDPHAEKPPTPEWNDIQYTLGFCKDPKGAKLSRIVTQPLEDETESVIENKLSESMKIMKAKSTSGSSGSVYRSQKDSVRPKKVLKKLFISDTETESSSAASWVKKKQVHLFHSPVHTYYKRKTMQTVSRTATSKPKRNESIKNVTRNPRKRNCRKVRSVRDEVSEGRSVRGRHSDSERSKGALSELDCVDLVVENCNKPSAVPLSGLHRTLTLSDNEEGDNTVATKGRGRHVYEPYIINLKTQENTKSTMNNACKRNLKESVPEVEPNMESIHFTDANPGSDKVCENSPVNHPLPTDCSKPKPVIRKSKIFNRECTRDSSIKPKESALGDNENTETQDRCPDHSKRTCSYSYDHEEIAPTEECSTLPMPKGSRESYLLIEENVNSMNEESGKEFQMQRYFQSVSEESFSGKERNEESNKMESSSNVNKSTEILDLEFPSGVAEEEPQIDYCFDSMSSTEKASQSEVIEEKELHEIPEVPKELKENLPRKLFRSQKRKYEDNDLEDNNKTQPTKSTQEETETHESTEIINEKLRKRKACQKSLDETPNSSSKKEKDLNEIMNNNKAHSMEKSTAHIAREKNNEEIRKFKTFKKHTEKFENILESNQNKNRISKDINESTGSQVSHTIGHSLLLDMPNQEKNKEYKRKGLLTSTPKARKEISYLKKKHCLSLLKLEEEIDSLNHRLLQTLKKYSESFRIDVAITRQSILRCTEMMLQESDYCEKDLEYLYANIKQRRAHITKSIKKIMNTANEYFEMERKRTRKMRHVQTKAIGKFISSIHKAEQEAIKSVQQQVLIEAQETFNGFLKNIIYY